MGWWSDIVDRVRKSFVNDKDQKAMQARKGRQTRAELMGAGGTTYDGNSYDGLSDYLALEHGLIARYIDYEEMDDYPELSSALDIYADDATQVDSIVHKTVWATSRNGRVREILNDLLHNRLRLEEEAWPLARMLAKYGNHYAEILLGDEGVVGLNFLPPPTMRRIEDANGALLGFIQQVGGEQAAITPEEFRTLLAAKKQQGGGIGSSVEGVGKRVAVFEDWEVVHWRLRSKHQRSVYGFSILEPARYIWRRLVLMEDAAVLHKLTKAPGRYAFYIDTGELAPQQALAYVEQVKQKYKKKKYLDSQGRIDFKVNPMGMDEDFWIPVRSGKESTRIEPISGSDWQSLDDINYFREKLFAAIKVPPSYMGVGGEGSKASLAQEDVRFARSVMRLQREVRNGIRKACRVHLIAKGIDPDSIEWDIGMTVPSTIFELAQLEVRGAQAQLAGQMLDFATKEWIQTRIFGFSEAEAKAMRGQMERQAIEDTRIQAKAQMAAAEILGDPDAAAAAAEVATRKPAPAAPAPPEEEPEEEPKKKPAEEPKEESAGALRALMSFDYMHSQTARAQAARDIAALDKKYDALVQMNVRLTEEVRSLAKAHKSDVAERRARRGATKR